MAALGNQNVAIKGKANEAFVKLKLGDNTYTRRLDQRSGGIIIDGRSPLRRFDYCRPIRASAGVQRDSTQGRGW